MRICFRMSIRLKRHFMLFISISSIAIFLSLWGLIHSHRGSWMTMPSNKEIKSLTNTNTSQISKPGDTAGVVPKQNSSPLSFADAVNASVIIAKSIMKNKQPVLFTLINNAYLPFVYSWLCNTIYMDVHDQILFITTDEKSKTRLNKDWPNVNVVTLPEESGLNENQAYSKVGYVKLMVKRTEILNSLLMNNIEVLLFEVDCLWISNPIEDCKKRAKTNDVIVTSIAKRANSIAGGFIYMKPTVAMKKLWKKLTEKMRNLGKEIQNKDAKKAVSEAKNDQMFFMQLIQGRFGGIKFNILPWDYYPDGQWYQLKKSKRAEKKPVIINNNWVIGNTKKFIRAKKWGHWFVDKNLKCCMDDVDKVVNKGLYNTHS